MGTSRGFFLFLCLIMPHYAHLASVRFEHTACCGSLMTTLTLIYILELEALRCILELELELEPDTLLVYKIFSETCNNKKI